MEYLPDWPFQGTFLEIPLWYLGWSGIETPDRPGYRPGVTVAIAVTKWSYRLQKKGGIGYKKPNKRHEKPPFFYTIGMIV